MDCSPTILRLFPIIITSGSDPRNSKGTSLSRLLDCIADKFSRRSAGSIGFDCRPDSGFCTNILLFYRRRRRIFTRHCLDWSGHGFCWCHLHERWTHRPVARAREPEQFYYRRHRNRLSASFFGYSAKRTLTGLSEHLDRRDFERDPDHG